MPVNHSNYNPDIQKTMAYDRFKNEDELLKALLKSKGTYNLYPKVTVIAGERVRPDIDLLEIYKEGENQYWTIGYECKLMKFDQRAKALSWEAFYKGIGQALCYLRNGVQRAVLILGFHENATDDQLLEDFKTKLYAKREFLQQIFGPYLSIGFILYEGGTPFFVLESKNYFYHSDNEIKLLVDSLLQKKFRFRKPLLQD